MVSADALTIFSGIIILFRNSGKSADFPELPFHGWGFGTNSLGEGAFGMVGKLLIAPEALAICLKPWLPLRGIWRGSA